MPTYEYECQDCGHISEIQHLMSQSIDDMDAGCYKCGSHELKKLLSVPIIAGSSKGTVDSCPTGTCSLTRR